MSQHLLNQLHFILFLKQMSIDLSLKVSNANLVQKNFIIKPPTHTQLVQFESCANEYIISSAV